MERDGYGDGEVVTVTAKHLVRPDMNGHVQVARRCSAQTGLTLAGQPDPLAVLDARRDPHVDRARASGHPGALAFRARMLDDRTAAPAFGAGFGEPERALIAADDTRAVAVRADLRAGARTCPAAMAIRARCRAGEP